MRRYLLSLCDYVVMDGASGFSATAFGKSFRNDNAYMLYFDPTTSYNIHTKTPRRGENRTRPVCTKPTDRVFYGTNNAGW